MKKQRIFQWSTLDNAAKIFPPTSSAKDSKVLRFACELTEDVQPDFLQQALDKTLRQFPFYRSRLKKGIFWYYLEEYDYAPQVEPETDPPCSMLYSGDSRDALFRVSWYRKRINLEVYHALSDGTGALNFLRVLVAHYLTLAHDTDFEGLPPLLDYDASATQKMDDSFAKYYSGKTSAPPKANPAAYHLHGARLPDYRLSIIEGQMSARALLNKAHEYGVTLTVFLVSALISSIHSQMSLREEKRPVVITVPVNLRNYFPSATARNFFNVVNVGYDFSRGNGEFADIVAAVSAALKSELTAEKLAHRMNRLAKLEHMMLLRVIPLFLKIPVLRLFNYLSDREITASFSNIGKVDMPAQLHPYIRLFDIFFVTRRMQTCMATFGDTFVITFTTPFVSADVQREFFRTLTGMGIDATITSNLAEFEEAD
ncbi:MAG: hypothetical protein PHG73_02460 [Pygmaiobacter sp.]|nr:hypothetical protein [Pygmaiobacter sp.]